LGRTWRGRAPATVRPLKDGTSLKGEPEYLLTQPSRWDGFIVFLTWAYSPGRPCQLITALGRLLDDDGQPAYPQELLERARQPGRSMGPLARSLETFFTEHGLARPTDQAEQLAAGRQQRHIDAVPAPLRPAVNGFADSMLAARERARRAITRPRTDHTVETALATMRDLALFLDAQRGKQDWALPTSSTSRHSPAPFPVGGSGG
jgi:hypothetical protein